MKLWSSCGQNYLKQQKPKYGKSKLMPNDYRFVSIRALDVLALNSYWMGNLSMVDILVKIPFL